MPSPLVYGLLAEFAGEGELVGAIRAARQAGYTRLEAYSPHPLEEASKAMGVHRTAVPAVVFLGGLVGCAGGYFLQYWVSVIDYPIIVGGRPLNSWPSFIPVTFELTILTAAMAALFGLMALCGLPRLYHPVFNVPAFARATRDRFFLCLEASDPRYDADATRSFLGSLSPLSVTEVPR